MIDHPVEHHAPYSAKIDNDWRIGDYFGTIFVINLPTATERLAAFQKSLAEVGVYKFEILPATNGRQEVDESIWKKMTRNWNNFDLSTPLGVYGFDRQRQGETGCYLSHLRVLKKMLKRYSQAKQELAAAKDPAATRRAKRKLERCSRVLILEDDNSFGIVKGTREATLHKTASIFHKAMKELPKDWDMLYFMAFSLHKRAERHSSHLAKLNYGLCLNAYAVNHKMYPVLIKQLERIYDSSVTHVDPVDMAVAELHPKYQCFAITPSLAYQREGMSSITSGNQEYFRQEQPLRH